jgi:hypothetical protein
MTPCGAAKRIVTAGQDLEAQLPPDLLWRPSSSGPIALGPILRSRVSGRQSGTVIAPGE